MVLVGHPVVISARQKAAAMVRDRTMPPGKAPLTDESLYEAKVVEGILA